jgi:outer membrane lipoprotein-sorting protein
MQKLNLFFLLSILLLMVTGCQTIKEKTDAIVEKENEKLSKYISKPASVLQMDLGKPDEDFTNAKGNFEFIYNTKKYGIPCERRFEINSENIVVGFVSNGCF